MKLAFAAPASGLPSLPTAFASHASLVHLPMKLFRAAPASGLPSLPTAFDLQLSCAATEPIAAIDSTSASTTAFITHLPHLRTYATDDHRQKAQLPGPES